MPCEVNYLLRKIIRRNLTAGISLVEIDITLKVASILANVIASFRFHVIATFRFSRKI